MAPKCVGEELRGALADEADAEAEEHAARGARLERSICARSASAVFSPTRSRASESGRGVRV